MVTETVIIVFKARKIKKGSYKNVLENVLSCSSRLRTTERTITQCRQGIIIFLDSTILKTF